MENKCERTNLTLLPYHHPLLRVQAEAVEFPLSSEDLKLINDMLYSVEDSQLKAAKAPWSSAAGMAAPQWGASRRIFVIRKQYLDTSKYVQKYGIELQGSNYFVVVINPQYEGVSRSIFDADENSESCVGNNTENDKNQSIYKTPDASEESIDWEGCFSVPGKRGKVRRFKFIRAKFYSLCGTEYSIMLDGWTARVFQHETDHTEGRLYDDSVANICSMLIDA